MPAAVGIGPYTLGKDLVAVTIATVTVTVTGTGGTSGTSWTAGASVDCTGMIRRVNHQLRVGLKDIRPITQVQENNVAVSTGNSLQLTNLRMANNATPGNPISSLVAIGLYVQCVFTDSHEQFSGYYVVSGYESGFDGIEEQVQSLDLAPVAIQGGQVVRTFV